MWRAPTLPTGRQKWHPGKHLIKLDLLTERCAREIVVGAAEIAEHCEDPPPLVAHRREHLPAHRYSPTVRASADAASSAIAGQPPVAPRCSESISRRDANVASSVPSNRSSCSRTSSSTLTDEARTIGNGDGVRLASSR